MHVYVYMHGYRGSEGINTTGFPSFAESPKLSAKRISLSADHLPRAALGKERSAKGLPAKVYLPRAPLGKLFAESKIKTLSKT